MFFKDFVFSRQDWYRSEDIGREEIVLLYIFNLLIKENETKRVIKDF